MEVDERRLVSPVGDTDAAARGEYRLRAGARRGGMAEAL